MSKTIPLLQQACENIGMRYELYSSSVLKVYIDHLGQKFHICIANNLGLNSEVIEKICRDKEYTYLLLSKHISMPKTVGAIDPHAPEIYVGYAQSSTTEEVAQNLVEQLQLPIVVKPNSKSMGINVAVCKTGEEVQAAVDRVFDKKSYQYDHVVLGQELVEIHKEYRVLVYKGEIQFCYLKDNRGEGARFTGNVSPLHFEGARATLTTNLELLEQLQEFISPIFSQINLVYAGLDIARDLKGNWYLLEINSKPGFSYFVKDNGPEQVVQLFEKILSDLKIESHS